MVRVFEKMEESPEVALHGQVLTKPHVVELILDLIGYTPDKDLPSLSLLDPGCGKGAFLVAALRRLLSAAKRRRAAPDLSRCLLGIEKDADAAEECARQVRLVLEDEGFAAGEAKRLAQQWLVCADFLDRKLGRAFDFVVGNPPYVRQEAIPKDLLDQYRAQFTCMYDRADLYVAFFEKGVQCLSDDGRFGFICPDRFARNKYGSKLRDLITTNFKLRHVIDLSDASPFVPEVIAYPGIFIIERGKTDAVDHVCLTTADSIECNETRAVLLKGKETTNPNVIHHVYETWFTGEQQWTTESPKHLELLHRLERQTVPLGCEASGCKVGIGVATGADAIFIVDPEQCEVEAELLVPLVTPKDIASGRVEWSGRCVINPFASETTDQLIDLAKYPKARAYFRRHEDHLRARNVGKRNPDRWYRTIDRIRPSLTAQPKLLVPDIKAYNNFVYEDGKLYPHHNLYYVVSDYWNPLALRTILRSSVATFFVKMYGVKMRAGYFRFQAQYLRKIGIPSQMTMSRRDIERLTAAHSEDDIGRIDALVGQIYGLTDTDMNLIHELV